MSRLIGLIRQRLLPALRQAGHELVGLSRDRDRRRVLPLGVPGWALRLAVGEMAGMLLHGSQIEPRRARELGYRWRHPGLASALNPLAGRAQEGTRSDGG